MAVILISITLITVSLGTSRLQPAANKQFTTKKRNAELLKW